MADYGDQRAANPAPVNGISDDNSDFERPTSGLDPSNFSKFSDSHSFDPYSSQPSSLMAQNDYDPSAHEYEDYQDEADPARANENAYYGQFQEDKDLPANFAKEAARHHNFPESYNSDEDAYVRDPNESPEEEAEEIAQEGNGSNPFALDSINKVTAGGNYVDNSDRPIMGYNPFLNEETRYERDEEEVEHEHSGLSEDVDNFQVKGFGGPGQTVGREHDEREINQAYNRLEEDQEEDDADLHKEPVESAQHYHDEEKDDDEGHFEEEKVVGYYEGALQSPSSFSDENIHSDDTRAFEEQHDLNLCKQPARADFEEQYVDDRDGASDSLEDLGIYDTREHQGTGADDYEKVGNEDELKDVENIPPQPSQTNEEELGIVNQGFSDDGEEGKVIPEEEESNDTEAVGSKASDIVDTELYEEHREEIPEVQRGGEDEAEEQVQEEDRQFQDEEERFRSEQRGVYEEEKEFTQENAYTQEQLKSEEEELEEVSPTKEDYTPEQLGYEEELKYIGATKVDYSRDFENYDDEESDKIVTTEKDYKEEQFRDDEDIERVSALAEEYTTQQLRLDDQDVDRATSERGDNILEHPRHEYDEADNEENQFNSRFSDVLSSEHEDRSFVDNLAEVSSPDTIPQPLPSPPEPKNVSSFDPLAPGDSTSPCHEPEENLGQHGALFQHGVEPDENNTSDFFTAGEVEGETKFGVDGTAITSTSQNNTFLHSEDDEEEEDEEEESSQHLEQGVLTATGTTETETSIEDRSGEYGVQGSERMEGNDNALMSMSMEGSFYDDGGELIGGDDRRNQLDNHLYEGVPISEESGQHDTFEQKKDDYGTDHDEFGQQIQKDFTEDQGEGIYHPQDDFESRHQDDIDNEVDAVPAASGVHDEYHDEGKSGAYDDDEVGIYDDKVKHDMYDDEVKHDVYEDEVKPGAYAEVKPAVYDDEVKPSVYDDEVKPGEFDSSVDAEFTEQVSQTPAAEHEEIADSSVDKVGADFTANESESSADSQQQEQQSPKSLEGNVPDIQISEVATEKPEEPASCVEEPPSSGKEESTSTVPEAAAATAAGVAVAAAAAAAATTKTTTTVKKSSAKAGSKTATTTTKVTTATKTANGKTMATKKSEITTTSKTTAKKPADSRPTSAVATEKKPADSRPTSAVTTEKKTPAKTTSPTKPSSTTPASAKSTGPLPSYAQPITPRKPREVKSAASPASEEKKKPAATTTTTATSRTSSASHRAPRPQSVTAATSGSTATKTTARTSTTTTTVTKTSTASMRPKSSPTKLTNGTSAAPSDTKTPTKKYGIDSKNEGYKPAGGSAKAASEKKEVKAASKVDAGSKTATPGAATTKSPTKTTTPRTTTTPKTSEVKSKIGSLDNAAHTPSGGNVRIASKKPDFTNVTSKIGSKDKMDHKPGGGNVKIESKKLKVEAKSKIGSLNNATHKPGGGDKKIETQKVDWKVESKVGSLDQAQHVPGGGDKKIESKKLNWKVDSKIGSLDNAQHRAGGGDKKIETKKLDWKVDSKVGSLDNAEHKAGGGDKKIESHKVEWQVGSKIGSLDNAKHTPAGGNKKIEVQKTEWKAQSKIGSLDNVKHKPVGGDKQAESQKTSKIGSLDAGPGSGSEQGAVDVHNGAASEN